MAVIYGATHTGSLLHYPGLHPPISKITWSDRIHRHERIGVQKSKATKRR